MTEGNPLELFLPLLLETNTYAVFSLVLYCLDVSFYFYWLAIYSDRKTSSTVNPIIAMSKTAISCRDFLEDDNCNPYLSSKAI